MDAPELNVLSDRVIACAIEVHRELGPGLLESVYEEALCHELSLRGLRFERQEFVPIEYKGEILGTPLRLDLVVEEKLIGEAKAKAELTPIDSQQLLTYLRLRKLTLGLVLNFGRTRLVDGISRVVNQLKESS